jgi:hypothetical protein
MGTEWTKHDVVELLDFHVWNLRILARRSAGPVTPEEKLCLPAAWSIEDRSHHSLYDFDLAGIKASGYPEVFNRLASVVYATPQRFLQFVAGALENSAEGAHLIREWQRLPFETILLDPRYVAFRTSHDWITLHARSLAEDHAASRQALDLSGRPDPFHADLPVDVPYELTTLTAANPLHLADGGFRNRWDPNYAEPWCQVRDRIGAIHYFHFRATAMLQKLRGGFDNNPRGLAYLVAMRIAQDAMTFPVWHGQTREEVERDPRFIAHQCAFNRGRVPGIAGSHNEWRCSRTAALEMVEQIRFEEYAAFLGEPTEYYAKPN